MDPQEQRKRIGEWVAYMRGTRTGIEFAKDVNATTGWTVDRSRLSRYENASIPVGRDTIAHLSEYAERKGLDPLDLSPKQPVLSYEERHLALLAKANEIAAQQVVATREQTAILRGLLLRQLDPDEAEMAQLRETLLPYVSSAMQSPRPQPDRPGVPAR